jgi:hypothetical protein
VCVEEFAYNADGTIPTIKMTTAGPAPVATLNPFQQVEAETIAFSSGLKTETCTDTDGGMNVTSISNGDYIKVGNVDFLDGVTSFDARVSSAASNAKIELHLDSQTGTSLGTCDVSGISPWTTKTCSVSGGSGKHDLFMKFTGGSGDLFKFNWWKFTGPRMSAPDGGAGGAIGADGSLGGTGGGGGTVAGTGGRGGFGGVPGTGGSASGTGGSGGTATGGAGGMATGAGGLGSGGRSTGAGGSGGLASGVGGSVGSGGRASGGDAGSGGRVVGSGGASGSAGSGGSSASVSDSGGNGSGGRGGSNPGSGGAVSPSSSGGTAGSSANPGNGSSGCTCRMGSSRGEPGMAVLLLLSAVALLRRREVRRSGKRPGLRR